MAVLCFGEILWDIFEDGEHIGGASYNVAAHISKLGLSSCIYSRLGEDRLGKKALEAMQKHGVCTDFVQIDTQHPTGTAGVVLDRQAVPTFTIANNTAYDFIQADQPDIDKINGKQFDLFYFGTVAQKGETSRTSLQRILSACTFRDIFFDINIRKPFYSAEIIHTSLSHATILKINDGELVLLGELFFDGTAERHVTSSIFRKYKNIHTILVTKGPDGAVLYTKNDAVSMNYCVSKAVDTVGAGDAFSAGFISAYLSGMNPADAAKRGNILADFVASQKGAVPDYDPEIILKR